MKHSCMSHQTPDVGKLENEIKSMQTRCLAFGGADRR